jgi:YihY family inner membrane protein
MEEDMATAAQGTADRTRRDEYGLKREASKGEGAKRKLSTLRVFWTKCSNDWVFNLSAMLAYNFLMSAFPILLVLLAIGGFLLGVTGTGGQSTLAARLSGALPNGSGQALLVNVTNNLNKSAGPLFAVGLVVAIFTGSRLFITIENCFGIIFRLRGRNLVRQNLMAIGMLLLYSVLVPLVLLTSIVPSAIVRATPLGSNNPLAGFFVQAAGLLASVLVAIVLFGAIYFVVPNRPVHLYEVWKGTLVASALLVLYELLFPVYLALFLHPNNYGSTAGFAVVILLFFYYLGVILLLGAEVNSWASGQRQTGADIDAIMHEVQAHNTTRGAAGPTAGTPREDIEHGEGAAVAATAETDMRHERAKHKDDEQPPKFAESGVRAPGYNVESQDERQQIHTESGAGMGAHNGRPARADGSRDGRGPQPAMRGAYAPSAHNAHDAKRASAGDAHLAAYAPSQPLNDRQRKALGAVVATGAVAMAPVLRWCVRWLRDEDRPTAAD